MRVPVQEDGLVAGTRWEHVMYWSQHKLASTMTPSVIVHGKHYQFGSLLSNASFTQNLLVGTAIGLALVFMAGLLRYRCYGFDR